MGLPMAKNILKSGYSLKAFNRSQNKAEALKEFKLYPAFNMFLAIGKPIKPMPKKPIFLIIYVYFLGTNSWKFCVVNSGKNITQAKTINWITIKGPNPLKISVKDMCGGATDFK